MNPTPLRYAVIGAGGISATHLNAIATLPGIEVVGISDPADPATWRTPDGYGAVPKFTNPEKMLAETKPDLVSICTPNKFHAPLTQLALSHGAHVACEKPMAMTLAEAEAMEAARAQAGKHGGINFSYRNVGAFRFARELVARGDLGKLLRVNCVYLQSFLGAPAQPYTWRNDVSLAGFGALGDLGVHMLDGVNFITGLDYQRVVGLAQTLIPEKPDAAGRTQPITTDTNAAWLSELAGGVIACFETSQVAPGYGNFFRIELSGEGGTLAVQSDTPDALWLRAGPTLTRYGTWQTDIPKQVLPTEYLRGFKPVTPAGIVRAIRGETGAEYPSFADGLRAQRMLDAIGRSMASQSWVSI
ncbi:MAG: Gfo/Idh/MocA family protein [Cephaloticoccus sp.]